MAGGPKTPIGFVQ